MKTPFLGQAYTARSSNLQAQRLVNLYPETAGEGGREVGAFFGTPGLVEWCDLGTASAVQGLIVVGAYLYAVSGNKLHKISQSGAVTELGTVAASGRVSMATNGEQILIANGSDGKLLQIATDTLSTPTGIPFGCVSVAYMDGYFIAAMPDTQKDYQSDLMDGETWDALNFASKEGGPDNLVAVLTDHLELWKFGERTTEVWYNANAGDYRFARQPGAFIEHGIMAPRACVKADNSVYWLGQDANGTGTIYRAQGYQPQRLSTHSVELAISGYATADAYAWTYQQEGHTFICFAFPTDGKCWCFDAATGSWHERNSFSDGELTRYRCNCVANFAGNTLVGDYANGKIYRFDLSTYTDDGGVIKRVRSWGHIANGNNRIRHNALTLIGEAGVGTSTGQGADPTLMLRWSDDGGHTWSNEHTAKLGKIGKYGHRAIWRRLGTSRDRVYEVSMTDPVKAAWMGAELDAEAMR